MRHLGSRNGADWYEVELETSEWPPLVPAQTLLALTELGAKPPEPILEAGRTRGINVLRAGRSTTPDGREVLWLQGPLLSKHDQA